MSLLDRLKSRLTGPKPAEHLSIRSSLLRRKKLLARAQPFLPWFWRLLLLIGVGWLVALPWREEYVTSSGKRKYKGLGRGHYVSENALQPGQVNTYWNWADVHIADLYAEEMEKWAVMDREKRANALQGAFEKLGLPAATQEYTFRLGSGPNSTLTGTNVYSIYQAPKTDGAEALVLSASWLSRAIDADGKRSINYRGVALVLALANYLKKASYWSKDIIFLLSDGYAEGTQAWLDAYHGSGQSNLETEELSLTTGPIWAALNIDYPYHSFSHVGLFFEGSNGHLPNLDFINSASHILRHSGIHPILHSDISLASSPAGPSLLSRLPAPLSTWLDTDAVRLYQQAASNMATQLVMGALGKPSGPEGTFGKYRIDAITLFGVPAEGPHGFHALGRAAESTFRSLNNLLERFHQSFFLYIMTSVDTFVTVGNYLAAPVLVSAGMTIRGLSMWSEAEKGQSKGERLRRPIGRALAVVGATHAIGAVLLVAAGKMDATERIWPQLPATLILALLFTPLLLSTIFGGPRSPTGARTSTILKTFTLLLGGLTIAIVATLNFGASVFLSLLLPLPLLLARPISRKRSHVSKLQQVLLVLCHPPVMWAVWRAAGGHETAENWARERLEDWLVFESWSLPFSSVISVYEAELGCAGEGGTPAKN